ncbi:MAG: hypothetical protein ACK6BG_04865 [Cyanobacteriota bacterium]
MDGRKKAWPAVEHTAIVASDFFVTLDSDQRFHQEFDLLADSINEAELVKERRSKERGDAARFTFWAGAILIGIFLLPLINLAPARFSDPTWQLNLITLLMANGVWALLGALLICLSRLLNQGDRMIRNRSFFVRNLSSWIALGWLLLIPLQLFLSVRLVNSLTGSEINEIQNVQRISRLVSSANTEDDLRAALAQIPNQQPLPRLNVPLEVARSNILGQLQRNINAAKNRQEQRTSQRWQTWLKEAFRNSIQCGLLAAGFLAIGKKRNVSATL